MIVGIVGDFYKNKAMRTEVRAYIEAVFNKEIIEKVYAREDVSHIADANDLVERAFTQMELDFGSKKKSTNLNEAR